MALPSLASYQDANGHLDKTKIKFDNEVDARPEQDAAYREIGSWIGWVWPDLLPNWDHTPDVNQEETPITVRHAASLFMAAYRYRSRYSEEELGESDFSARLERQAKDILSALAEGRITLWDKDYGSILWDEFRLEQGDFWPNDSYTRDFIRFKREREVTDPGLQPERAFSMHKDW